MLRLKTFKENVIEYIYVISKQPILLRDLLIANRQYNEGMHVEAAKLGFRLILSRAYFVYTIFILFMLLPIFVLTHQKLAYVDAHISILGAVIITAIIFMGFNCFRSKLRDIITLKLIKKSWKLHFPYFSYEEYSLKIEEIFEKSLKHEISKRNLEKYILDNLST